MAISGIYCDRGYVVMRNGEPYYSAGNSEYDSEIYADPDMRTLSLSTIKSYCESTMAEMADEFAESLGIAVYADNTPDYFINGGGG